jgi:hypothetical protein
MDLANRIQERYMEWCVDPGDPRDLGEMVAEEFFNFQSNATLLRNVDYEQAKILAKWLLEDQNGKP